MALPGEKIWHSGAVISFPDWAEVLAGAGFGEEQVAAYRQAILGFLHFCKGGGHRLRLRWPSRISKSGSGKEENVRRGCAE